MIASASGLRYRSTMHKLVVTFLVMVVVAFGCDTKVKQQRPPRIPDDPNEGMGDADISEQPVDETVAPVEEKKTTPQQRRHRCCKQCQTGLEADKSGDAPDNIPCQDFTVHVKQVCLKWFHKNPMKASEAKACVDEGPGDSDDEAKDSDG